MRFARNRHLWRSVASYLLLLAIVAACSDDDPAPVKGTATVVGVFTGPGGSPLQDAPIDVFVLDSGTSTFLEGRTLSTNARGGFSTTFEFPPASFPLQVQVRAKPPLGSGLQIDFYDSTASLPPGRTADTLTYTLEAVQVEPPVNDIAPASFDQGALRGHYWGQSVSPLENFVIVYLDLDITGTIGSVSGRYDIDYNATLAMPDGTILGAVLLDTLRLQLTSDSTPGQPREVASFKAIATSSTADTLIATPDPCTGRCWLFVAPLRLIRTP